MQWSPDFPACECGIRRIGALAGLLVLPENNGIEPRIVVLHTLQIELQQLTCAHVFALDLVSKRERRRKGQMFHYLSSLYRCCRTPGFSCCQAPKRSVGFWRS
jgi:hypothetical protein